MTKEEAAEIVLDGTLIIPCNCGCNDPKLTMVNPAWLRACLLLRTMNTRQAVDAITIDARTEHQAYKHLARHVLALLYRHRGPWEDSDVRVSVGASDRYMNASIQAAVELTVDGDHAWWKFLTETIRKEESNA